MHLLSDMGLHSHVPLINSRQETLLELTANYLMHQQRLSQEQVYTNWEPLDAPAKVKPATSVHQLGAT